MPQKQATTKVFKERIFNKLNNKVEILSEYNGGTEPIDLVYHCEKHGDKYKTINAKNILSKSFQPCDECNSERKSKAGTGKNLKDKQSYYDKLKKKIEAHGGKLITKQWTKAKDDYEIICEKGHAFTTTADCINSKNQWCPYCSGREGDFEKEINDIAKSKNGVILEHYVNATTHVKAKCNIHNYEWDIMPMNIKKGRWCPVCNLPYSEKVVYDYLTDNNYNIKIQYTFDDLKSENDEFLKFDFVIMDKLENILFLLEVDDNEHRYNTKQPRRIKARERDGMKNDYCIKNNIKLFRMKYDIYEDKRIYEYNWYYEYIKNEINKFENRQL